MEEENLDILPEGDAPADIQEQLDEDQEDIPRERGGEILDELTGTKQRIYGREAKYGKFDQLVRDGKLKEAAEERRRLEELEEETNPETGWPNLYTSGTLESYIKLQEPSYWETDKSATSFATSPMFSEQVGETQFPNLYSGGTATDYSELGKFLGASYTSLRDMDAEPVKLPWYVKKVDLYGDGTPVFKYNNKYYHNYSDIVFIGEDAADVIQQRFSKAWNWLPDEVKSVLVTGGKGLSKVTQWALGPAGMQILQGIDSALTWTANQGANIAPIDPRLTKGILEFLPELVAGGVGTANKLRKGLDTFSDLNKVTYATNMGRMSGTAAAIYGPLTGGENLTNLAKTSLAIKGTKAASGSGSASPPPFRHSILKKTKRGLYKQLKDQDPKLIDQAENIIKELDLFKTSEGSSQQFTKWNPNRPTTGFVGTRTVPYINSSGIPSEVAFRWSVRKGTYVPYDLVRRQNTILRRLRWNVNRSTKAKWYADKVYKIAKQDNAVLKQLLNELREQNPQKYFDIMGDTSTYATNKGFIFVEHIHSQNSPYWKYMTNQKFKPRDTSNLMIVKNDDFGKLKTNIENHIYNNKDFVYPEGKRLIVDYDKSRDVLVLKRLQDNGRLTWVGDISPITNPRDWKRAFDAAKEGHTIQTGKAGEIQQVIQADPDLPGHVKIRHGFDENIDPRFTQ